MDEFIDVTAMPCDKDGATLPGAERVKMKLASGIVVAIIDGQLLVKGEAVQHFSGRYFKDFELLEKPNGESES